MAGKADMRSAGADACEQVVDFAITQWRHCEAETLQRIAEHLLRTGVRGRHRGAADQRLRKGKRIMELWHGGPHGCADAQSRSNSLIEVFARVCSSTVLTMTAQ